MRPKPVPCRSTRSCGLLTGNSTTAPRSGWRSQLMAMTQSLWNGVTDYCLYDASGNVLAVVEAKRCSRNAREADEQLRHYVTEIAKKQPFAPFGFMANGHDIWFWEVGLANPRLVAGFFAPADLERLKFLRQNRRPLEATPINSSIVDRSYQHEAIRRLAEAFAANKRRALLVMATGTGKTRVAMALIDVFLRANQAQNVLFLADRDALVVDAADVNPTLPVKCKKTEILFLHLFLRLLENGGRAAVIVPDSVLFGSSNAHVDIRKKIIEENRLDGIASMPSGVFRPYAGVSTAVLLFTKGGTTEKIWFYDMEHDGYSLDDKRQKVPENDIPDV